MKKIAIIYRNLAGYSGVPNIVCKQASSLVMCGYEVHLVAERVDPDRFDLQKMKFIKVRRLPFFKNRRVQSFSERANRIAGKTYDFVAGHGNNTQQHVLSLHNCAHLYYERIPDESHGARPDAVLQDQIFAENHFRCCITNSVLMRDELVRRYQVEEKKLKVVYPGYDPDRFNTRMREDYRNETRSYWHINPGIFLIGLVTSGAFQLRGVDIAINAYAGLPDSIRADTRMVIVGNNSQIAQYRQRVSSLGLSDLIFFYPASRKIERCYHALDVLIHPARLETFGLVVQEAMACGVPVITNRQVGAAELLPPEARTQLAEFPDVDDLKEKLEKMICDHQFRQRWTEYGNTAVAANTEQAYFDAVLEIYRAAGL